MPAGRFPAASRRAGVLSILAVLPTRLLIANRGEIAIRIARAAAELGHPHRRACTRGRRRVAARSAAPTRRARSAGSGPAAYLDAGAADRRRARRRLRRVHPGYGFLQRERRLRPALRGRGHCTFVGPRPELLELFGDKAARARAGGAAAACPVLPGTPGRRGRGRRARVPRVARPGGVAVVKAVAGGGGRGMRVVRDADEVDDACRALPLRGAAGLRRRRRSTSSGSCRAPATSRCRSSATGRGAVTHLWERECTLQRRHQKLVEIAPSPGLAPALRARLLDAALRMAAAVRFDNLGTFEFLVDAADGATTRRSPSSRRTRGCRSSTPSPRR